MRTRIAEKFETLKVSGRKALLPFFMPGAQGEQSITDTIVGLEACGADLIELGVPFSDPMADGPVIQRSAGAALAKGMLTDQVFEAVKAAREKTDIPLLLLVYYNSVFKYGSERFAKACVDSGIDGLIIPDLPFEEQSELTCITKDLPLDIISLAARTSKDRLKMVLAEAEGFIYCVSTTGVTGERSEVYSGLADFLSEIKTYTDVPRCVGFGISDPKQAAEVAEYAEGVIVGSALVRRFLDENAEAGYELIRQMRKAMDE